MGDSPERSGMDEPQQRTVSMQSRLVRPRLFTALRLADPDDQRALQTRFMQLGMAQSQVKGKTIMRYAGYIRVSDEEQVQGYSLDAQERAIREWVAARGGTLTVLYADKGESGRTADRTEFL